MDGARRSKYGGDGTMASNNSGMDEENECGIEEIGSDYEGELVLTVGGSDMRCQVSKEHLRVVVRRTPVTRAFQIFNPINANDLEIIG